MQLGIDSYSFHLHFQWGGMDVFSFIRRAHEFGAAGVKINMGNDGYHLGSEDPAHLRRVRALLESLGMFVELDTRGVEPAHLARTLRICHALGGDALRTYASMGGDLAAELREAPAKLRQVLPLCAELGVRIGVENHEFETACEVLAMVEAVDSPWVGTMVDTGNSMPLWEDPVAAVETMAPRAVSTHIKDHAVVVHEGVPLVVGTPIGRGSIDCAACLRALVERSPLRRLYCEVVYGYGVPFRVPQEQGQGGRLGEGAFRVVEQFDPSWICPYPNRMPEAMRPQLVAWQEAAILDSLAYVRGLLAKG